VYITSKRSKKAAAKEPLHRKLTTKPQDVPKVGFAESEVGKGFLWGQQTQRSLKNFNIGK